MKALLLLTRSCPLTLGHCLERASCCCSGNRTLRSGVTVTVLGYGATEAVLGVRGVLRGVHTDLRLLTDVAVRLFRVAVPSLLLPLRYHPSVWKWMDTLVTSQPLG